MGSGEWPRLQASVGERLDPGSEGGETGLDSEVLWKVIVDGPGSGLKEEEASNLDSGGSWDPQSQKAMTPWNAPWKHDMSFFFSPPRWAAGNSRPSASSTRYGPATAASCSQWMTHSTSLWPRWRRDPLSLWSQQTPSAALALETQSPAGASSTVPTGDSPDPDVSDSESPSPEAQQVRPQPLRPPAG